MAMFKCPYCGAVTEKDGICNECDVGRVVPFYGEPPKDVPINLGVETIGIYNNPEPKCVTAKLVIGILSMVLFCIEEAELSFHVYDMEHWSTVVDTAPVTIKFDD